MGIQHTECLVLLLEINDQPRQHGMLQHVREIACVVDVAVIHALFRWVQ